LVEFPSSKIIADAIIRNLRKSGRGKVRDPEKLRMSLSGPAIIEFPTAGAFAETLQLQDISRAFGGGGKGGILRGLTSGQLSFLTNPNVQRTVQKIQLERQQAQIAKAEFDFLAKIQGAIGKQLESFKVPQIEAPTIDLTPMIESESQVKQEQPSSSIIPLAIIGAVLLG